MKIILSPAKRMREDFVDLPLGKPKYEEQAKQILQCLQGLSFSELQKLYRANIEITRLNYHRLEQMRFDGNLTPAIFAYDGIAYKHLAPNALTNEELLYLEEYLWIISGFYGILKPLDGISPYRLELQAKLKISSCLDLYEYWWKTLDRIDDVVFNLASDEYAKLIRPLVCNGKFVDVIFYQRNKNELVQKATEIKKMRGCMVRYMAQQRIINRNEMLCFQEYGYRYKEELSSNTKIVFVKE